MQNDVSTFRLSQKLTQRKRIDEDSKKQLVHRSLTNTEKRMTYVVERSGRTSIGSHAKATALVTTSDVLMASTVFILIIYHIFQGLATLCSLHPSSSLSSYGSRKQCFYSQPLDRPQLIGQVDNRRLHEQVVFQDLLGRAMLYESSP
jgi:hypothetical protein